MICVTILAALLTGIAIAIVARVYIVNWKYRYHVSVTKVDIAMHIYMLRYIYKANNYIVCIICSVLHSYMYKLLLYSLYN